MHPYVHLFSLEIPTYLLCGLAGIAAAAALIALRNRSFCLQRADIVYLSLYILVGALLGAKLLYLITVLPELIEAAPILIREGQMLTMILQGGMVFYGGLLGGMLAARIYARQYGLPLPAYADLFAPGVALMHAFGRVGCFFAGCCWGIETGAQWGVCYHDAPLAPNGVPLLPVQLIEAGCLLLLCAALLLFFRRAPHDGRTFRAYLGIYAVLRFILEFFRGDELRGVWLLSTSQWISLIILLALFVRAVRRRKTRKPLKDGGNPDTMQSIQN